MQKEMIILVIPNAARFQEESLKMAVLVSLKEENPLALAVEVLALVKELILELAKEAIPDLIDHLAPKEAKVDLVKELKAILLEKVLVVLAIVLAAVLAQEVPDQVLVVLVKKDQALIRAATGKVIVSFLWETGDLLQEKVLI
jgi:hypothetical protein